MAKRTTRKKTPKSGSAKRPPTRLSLIKKIESTLGPGYRVITYVTGSRPLGNTGHGLSTGFGKDVVRLFYDHFLKMQGDVKRDSLKVALFIISDGGDIAVPWRIVSMVREIASEFDVLVPYNAMSAATMIALGSDKIFMGPKGELGPIDPSVKGHPFLKNLKGDDAPVGVEDLSNYIAFVKDKVGIRGEEELIRAVELLADQVTPLGMGLLNRQHAYIRMLGQRLLDSRNDALDEDKAQRILRSLIEDVSFHGHGISRHEAKNDLSLHVSDHPRNKQLEEDMWQLYLAYERDFFLREPIDVDHHIDPSSDVNELTGIKLAAIESRYIAHEHENTLRVTFPRKIPDQINIQFQLPPGLDPANTDQGALQNLLNHLAGQINPRVVEAIKGQMPLAGPPAWEQTSAKWIQTR